MPETSTPGRAFPARHPFPAGATPQDARRPGGSGPVGVEPRPTSGVSGAQTVETVVRRWGADPRAVGRARHDLRGYLLAWGLVELADAAELVLSELVTNALRHADVPPDRLVETRWSRLPGGLRIEVYDADPSPPVRSDPAGEAEGGRGLPLVDAVTRGRWGVDGVGKTVWAEIVAPRG